MALNILSLLRNFFFLLFYCRLGSKLGPPTLTLSSFAVAYTKALITYYYYSNTKEAPP